MAFRGYNVHLYSLVSLSSPLYALGGGKQLLFSQKGLEGCYCLLKFQGLDITWLGVQLLN